MTDASTETAPLDAGWAAGLLASHGLAGGVLTPMAGWSNTIWASKTHVVRLASGRFEGSLTHEAAVLRAMPHAPVPRVVATGVEGAREWMIQTRLPGADLLRLWPRLAPAEREAAVRALGRAMAQVNATPLRPELREPPWRAGALRPGGNPSVALRSHPRQITRLVEANVKRGTAPADLLTATARFVEDRLPLFASDREVLTHGDLAFANVIWDGEQAGLVDFESGGAAAPDRELDVLLRFLTDPGAFSPEPMAAGSYDGVLAGLQVAYPGLFVHPALIQRLEVYDALWELVQLMNYPADHPRDTAGRLEAILGGRAAWKALLSKS